MGFVAMQYISPDYICLVSESEYSVVGQLFPVYPDGMAKERNEIYGSSNITPF